MLKLTSGLMKAKFLPIFAIFVIIIVSVVVGYVFFSLKNRQTNLPNASSFLQNGNGKLEKTQQDISQVAKNLDIPWAIAFTPENDLIFTQRKGQIRIIDHSLGLIDKPLYVVSDMVAVGEGGLLGLTLHPNFSQNHYLYIYYTFGKDDKNYNRVVRFKKTGNGLEEPRLIIDNIPGSTNHDGGRIKFGPDGFLYIGTGDSQNPSLAQDLGSTAGKILRLTDQGEIPKSNPFANSPVYSFGHRNVQGLTWDQKGQLWATEHGPSAQDELNLIEAGKNYGWPIISGSGHKAGMVDPVVQSANDTWAPSGAVYYQGVILFTGLRGKSLFEARIDNNRVTDLKRHFEGKFGRIREVVVGPDGFLYLATSNRDGRGIPTADDDMILKIKPNAVFAN